MRPNVLDMTRAELEAWMEGLGERPYRARQLMAWVYRKGVTAFGEMTDLSKALRAKLEGELEVALPEVLAREASRDGTEKFLLGLKDGQAVEAVLIPDEDRLTLCVSTQVGCQMGCRFCLTALGGFSRNLTSGEILGQVLAVRKATGRRITNVVLMGMGEPLDNYQEVRKAIEVMTDDLGLGLSSRRVTLSTVGLIPELERLVREGPRCRIAISLNAPDQETRALLMPISKRYPLGELLEACRALPLPPRDRITFEYVLIRDVNSSPEHARLLAEALRGIRCKVNLIPLNEAPEIPFKAPRPGEVEAFQKVLLSEGYTALVRESRGRDISAACGQLRGKVLGRRRS